MRRIGPKAAQWVWLALVVAACGGGAGAPDAFADGTGSSAGDGDGDGGCAPADPDRYQDPLVHLGRAEGDTFIEILDVVADGALVYACTGTQGLTIWDVSDPMQADLLVENVGPSGLANQSYPRCQHFSLHANQARAVITSRGDEIQPVPFLWLYDVSDPLAPVEVGGWSGDEHIEGAVFAGDRIVVAAHKSGILVFEEQGGGLVNTHGFSDDASDAWQPALVGDELVVAEGATGLRTYDLSGDAPVLLATLPLPGSSKDVVVRGDLAYVASSSSISIVDVADPGAPALVGQLPTNGTALAVALGSDDVLFTAEWDEVRGYDVSDPANPRLDISQTVPTESSTFTRVLALDAQPDTGLVFAGEWAGMHAFEHRRDGPAPEIWATPRNVNFGTVAPGDSKERVIIVENHGDAPLRIEDITSPNPDFEFDPTCVEIPPGQARAIEARFTPALETQSRDLLVFLTDDPDETHFTLEAIGNVPGLDVGDPAPAFELWDLDGQQWNNASIEGKVTLLAYFATF